MQHKDEPHLPHSPIPSPHSPIPNPQSPPPAKGPAQSLSWKDVSWKDLEGACPEPVLEGPQRRVDNRFPEKTPYRPFPCQPDRTPPPAHSLSRKDRGYESPSLSFCAIWHTIRATDARRRGNTQSIGQTGAIRSKARRGREPSAPIRAGGWAGCFGWLPES